MASRLWRETLSNPITASFRQLASPVAYMLYPVANSERFNKGEIDNFDQVGFRALDDWTLEIVLTNPTPYFSFPAESLLMVSGPHSDGRKVRASF